MMFVDLTTQLSPLLIGLDALFALSLVAVFGPSAVDAVTRLTRHSWHPRFVLHRAVLAR